VLNDATRRTIWRRFEDEIEEAVRFAQSSPHPALAEALADLFVVDTGYDY
jgi:TPP-dependent pyruvate/acetoin dehydrogenase alpha subunit